MCPVAAPDYVLLTRAAADCQSYRELIERRGYIPLAEPVLRIEPKADAVLPSLSGYDALVFTSANGIMGYCALTGDRTLPVYTVGDETADKARAAGFQRVESAGGTVGDLDDLLRAAAPGRLLYLRGADIARPLAAAHDACIVYTARPAEEFSPETLEILKSGRVRIAVLFSRRGALAFTAMMAREGLESLVKTIKVLCLSDSVLKSVAGFPWRETESAKRPDRHGMLDLLGRVLDE